MRMPLALTLLILCGLVAAGCSSSASSAVGWSTELQQIAADGVAGRDAPVAARSSGGISVVTVQPPRLLSAPTGDPVPAEEKKADSGDLSVAPQPVMTDRWWQRPLAGRSFGEVVKDDAKTFLPELWKSTKDTASVGNFVLLEIGRAHV